jgi:hypothetical protein
MIYYICDKCNEPAFYLKRKIGYDGQLFYEDVYTNGAWIPKVFGSIWCQSCGRRFSKLFSDYVMDNLEYVEYLAKQKNLI